MIEEVYTYTYKNMCTDRNAFIFLLHLASHVMNFNAVGSWGDSIIILTHKRKASPLICSLLCIQLCIVIVWCLHYYVYQS